MIVVDASVAVKWFLAEPGSAVASGLLDRGSDVIHGPDLLLIEVTGLFVRLANQRALSREDATLAIHYWTTAWRSGQVQSHRVDDRLASRAGHLAIEIGHPLKDCIYLALALHLGCALLTADAKFRDKAVEGYPAVQLLG